MLGAFSLPFCWLRKLCRGCFFVFIGFFMTLETVLSLFVLMLISVGTYTISRRVRVPYTVLLVLVGTILVPISTFPPLHFLREFRLTPELLFYIFLPILIFESAYSMRIRDLMCNVRAVAWFSVVSLLISVFAVAFGLFFVLRFLGMDIPFVVTLLFGAIISATDPVAVLALFKEFGVPRRLAFLFEGESLFNDGTALAMFLVVLEVARVGFGGAETVALGVLSFSTMVIGGIFFGIVMGFVFAKAIERVNNEHIEITLSLLVAHLTFILSEVISETVRIGGFEIRISSIIATVFASLVIGNYGRSKFSAQVTRFLEPFFSYFAFLANSLVFITMGLLFAGLPIDLRKFFFPVLVSVVVVMAARALSIYPVAAWLNFRKKERPIPREWQHLLSWGSLRGALAVIMVLLIPDTLSVPGWDHSFTVKEFITALSIGCIYFTLLVKATTIGSLIKRFKLDSLSGAQIAEYHQSRILIYNHCLERLESIFQKGYLHEDTYTALKAKVSGLCRDEYALCERLLKDSKRDFEYALRLFAIGVERYFLGVLFKNREVDESSYKNILTKLDVRLDRIEEGERPIRSIHESFEPDWFEQIARTLWRWFGREKNENVRSQERYAYYRAQAIVARKVIKEVRQLEEHSHLESAEYRDAVSRVIANYDRFFQDAERHMREEFAEHPACLTDAERRFGERSLRKAFEEGLDELVERDILPQKIVILLSEEFSR